MLKDLYKSPLFISVGVAVITLTIFWHVLSADFVMWDDNVIYENPNIQKLSFAHLGKIFTDVSSMMRYSPLTLLSWSITYHFWKLDPFWYHAVNWILHGASSGLVFLVLRKLLLLGLFQRNKTDTESGWVTISAALGALLWSLHPLRVEPAAWCTDRAYCQALFFLLLSLLCYLQSSEANITIKRHYQFLAASVVLYIVSLLSHAIGITFFFVLFILDVYPLGMLGGTAGWWKSFSARRTLLEKVPFAVSAIAVALVTVCIRIESAGVWEKPIGLAEFGLFERFMQAMYMCAYYIWRPWYPVNLSPFYTTLVSFDPLSLPFVASAIGVTGMIVLLILLRHRWPLALTLAICYLVLLVPVLGILEHPHYPCDRYSLIVSICFSVLIAAFLANPKTKKPARYIVFFLSIVAIVGLGTLSYRQTRIWNNTASLFEHTIRTLGDDPYSFDIHGRLGVFYFNQGQNTKAMEHLQKTIELKPNFIPAYITVSKLYVIQKEFDKAVMCLEKALIATPNSPDIHYFLGHIYLLNQQPDKTILHWKKGIELKPDSVLIMYQLARLLSTYHNAQFHDPEEAIRLARRCCELTEYKDPVLLDTLASAMASSNRFADAIAFAEKALQITRSAGDKELTEKILYHLNLYKTNQPYIEYSSGQMDGVQ
jgi:tetratricopeptide (TPR) repeat protein